MKSSHATSHRWAILGIMGLVYQTSLLVAQEPDKASTLVPRVEITCGDIGLVLREKSQWTPVRFDFAGQPMTTESSAYGTVFSYPGVGFIGTGHLENEPEDIRSVEFRLDGRLLPQPEAKLQGDHFQFIRQSRIRSFDLTYVVELKNNRIYEDVIVKAHEDTPLSLVYHFMHAWAPTVSAYAYGKDGVSEVKSGPLLNTEEVVKKFYINDTADWMAVYNEQGSRLGVSRLLEAPEGAGAESRLWNVPGTYRKYYLVSFNKQTVPQGFVGKWRMVTAFESSEFGDWVEKATALAQKLQQEEKSATQP